MAFHQYLHRSNFSDTDRAMLGACANVAFYGLLRASEFLAPSYNMADPERTLLWSSVKVSPNLISLQLKVTKTRQLGDGGVVNLQQSPAPPCPVRSLTAYSSLLGKKPDNQPVFAFKSGRYLTREELTRILRTALRTSREELC